MEAQPLQQSNQHSHEASAMQEQERMHAWLLEAVCECSIEGHIQKQNYFLNSAVSQHQSFLLQLVCLVNLLASEVCALVCVATPPSAPRTCLMHPIFTTTTPSLMFDQIYHCSLIETRCISAH